MLTNARSAATAIESWAREDPAALSSRPASDSGTIAPDVVADPPAAENDDGPSAPAVVPAPRGYLDLDVLVGVGFDGSAWFGGGLAGCAVLGPVCPGAGARIGIDPAVSGDSELLETRRLMVNLVGTLDFPVRFDAFALRPGIDIGAAFVRMSKLSVDEGGDHENSGDELWNAQRWEFAVGAHLTGAIQLGKGFALTVGVAALVLPAAGTDPLRDDDSSLAGVPRGSVRGIVGLEYAI